MAVLGVGRHNDVAITCACILAAVVTAPTAGTQHLLTAVARACSAGSGGDGNDPGRSTQEGTTPFQTAFNILNIFVGTGLLGMPYAMMRGGWAALAAQVGALHVVLPTKPQLFASWA